MTSSGVRLRAAVGLRFYPAAYNLAAYNLAHFAERQIVAPSFFIQGVFGVLGGIGAEPENLMNMKATAGRLFGANYLFSALAAGRHQMPMVTLSCFALLMQAVNDPR